MSRTLPARPNLEFLKNQAKELLPELQRQNAGRKLADAQHAIARQYGFVNWPALKAHVDSLAAAPAPGASPFTGTWVANLSKSTPRRDHPFRSATLRFDVAGDVVTIVDVVTDESGRETHGTNTLHADGQERVSEHGYAVTARWLGPCALDAVVMKGGRAEGAVRYEVSPDGTVLTLSTAEHSTVFERV